MSVLEHSIPSGVDSPAAPTLDRALKRILDVAVAAVALLLLAPLLACLAIAIKLDSRGPIFYRCERVGFRGRGLWMLKFRKMRADASGPRLTLSDDARFTRVGRMLARTKLDELPQLWHVLKGEMSLVGPRPEDPEFIALHPDAYARIHRVRPGITGLCQLALAHESDILDSADRVGHYIEQLLPQKVALDGLYADRRTLLMDLKVIAWTVVAIALRRDVAVHRGSGRMTLRRRKASASHEPTHAAVTNGTGHVSVNGNGNGGHSRRSDSNGHRQNGASHAESRRNGSAHGDSMRAIILAGGRGTRLAPYTSVLPKPLMPIGDRAILEHVIEQLQAHGITDITFCVGYLSHLIRAVFENRVNGHVQLTYVHEEEALGTAGPLRLVDGLDRTFVVMNGDVLTTLDYGDLLRHHSECGNALTIAARDRSIKIDYGILQVDGSSAQQLIGFDEKPEIVSTVSMGIYVLEPSVLAHIPAHRFDIPDLVQALLAAGERVGVYRHDGLWFDIGRQEDYEQAVAAWSDRAVLQHVSAGG